MEFTSSRPSGALRGFLVLAAALTAAGWGLSALKLMHWAWVALIPAVVGAAWIARRGAGSLRQLGREFSEPLAFWPTMVVLVLVLCAAVLYPPRTLDSLTYRLPRVLLWNQDGFIHHYSTPEERLNFSTPVWELCTLPLVQLGGIRTAWIWSCTGWLASLMVFFRWARETGSDVSRARRIAFLASTSTFAILQACGSMNDLLAVSFLLASVHFLRAFETTRDPVWINWSVLAFCLTTGVKPHYATLGLPLAIWFVAAPSQPWRAFTWRWLPLLLPLWLMCSLAPSFVMNVRTYGQVTGPATGQSFKGKGPQWNLLLGTPMMAWQVVQPCVNPLAFVLNEPIERAVAQSKITEIAPRFNMKMAPLAMVDTASLGALTSLWVAGGLWLVWRRDRSRLRSWMGWLAVAGMVGFAIAVSQVLVSAVGRSFLGFGFLGLPLVIAGWAWASERWLRWAVAACLVGSLAALVLNPARPLWPAQWLHDTLQRSGRAGLARALQPYLLIAERGRAGVDLVAMIPPGPTVLAAAIGEDRPILPFMLGCAPGIRVELVGEDSQPQVLDALHADYLLLSGGADDYFHDLCGFLKTSPAYEVVKSASYTSKLVRGPEVWTLYRRKTAVIP